MSFATQLRRYAVELAAVIGIIVISLAVAAGILTHQRLKFPWQKTYQLQADFTTAQAITPGQGQEVDVAGVKVGQVKTVHLKNGRARLIMNIDKDKLKHVHADARASLRPKTGLQDMTVQLDPGTRGAPTLGKEDVIPVAQTSSEVEPDEILAALDSDTRAWLQTLLGAGAEGLKSNGARLREVFKAGAPTLEATKRVSDAILARREQLRRVVHNLRLISTTAAGRDEDLTKLVTAANTTFGTLGDHDTALRATLAKLPGTLSAARAALGSARPFSRELKPAAASLAPTAAKLTAALPKLDPLLKDATPAVRRVRGLVKTSKPVVANLRPTLKNLNTVTPDLSNSFDVLDRLSNELAYNPPGDEEGYLFWLAWFAHNTNSMLSTSDANGTAWRGILITSCSTATSIPQLAPAFQLLTKLPVCPKDQPTPNG